MANSNNNFKVGMIEGFYGTPWSMDARLKYASWLSKQNLTFYIYAPKNDSQLRRTWQNPYKKEWLATITNLNYAMQKHHISFGVGISPLGATKDLNTNLPILLDRIKELVMCTKLDTLAILFDDLEIDNEQEGVKQNQILRSICELCSVLRKDLHILTCPSFYSTDPLLERIFGKRPSTYFTDFTRNIPENVDIFWTGSKVLSATYSPEDLAIATELLGRKPFIWDNYPVNDGKKSSEFLNLNPFQDRSTLIDNANGIAVNPMKQASLSCIPLASLTTALHKPFTSWQGHEELLSNAGIRKELIAFIVENSELLTTTALCSMTEDMKCSLITQIKALPNCEEQRELLNFMQGMYTFDPACLTG